MPSLRTAAARVAGTEKKRADILNNRCYSLRADSPCPPNARLCSAMSQMARILLISLLTACFLAGCAPPSPESVGESLDATAQKVPEKVGKVLKYIDEHHEAPPGYEGGREFHNAEGLLPK